MAYATKAAILTMASGAWATTFSGSKLDAAIIACLGDLNGSDLLVGSDATGALAAGDNSLAFPDNYKSIISIQMIDAAGNLYDPLVECPGGVRAYRYQYSADGSRGRPEYFVEDPASETFLLYPAADAAYTTQVDFWSTHPAAPDAIVYPAKFQHLLNLGTVYWEAVLRRNQQYINIWGPLYYGERQTRSDEMAPVLRSVIG